MSKDRCISCGHECCKWCGFTTNEMSGRSIEFYAARGCKILAADVDGERIYRVYIPHVCQHLVDGQGCAIYERRPLACIEYEGKEDPLTCDKCMVIGE